MPGTKCPAKNRMPLGRDFGAECERMHAATQHANPPCILRETLTTTWITASLLLRCNLTGLAPVHAGGSNYGIAPGTIANPASKVLQWPVPTPRFARDPAIAPDGSIFVAMMGGNKVACFDPKS